MAWGSVKDLTYIVIDSEKALREGKTVTKTFHNEFNIFKELPQVVSS